MTTISHPWNLSPQAAIAWQKKLAQQVLPFREFTAIHTVAGVDMSIRDEVGRAAAVVLSYPELNLITYSIAVQKLFFPYRPGLFSFREGPVVLEAIETLTLKPDLLIFDGQGIAHPRRFGLAAHIGLLTDLPAIGCAKSHLWGHYEEPGLERGSYTYLTERGETIGAVVRTRTKVKPVFVSIGHRIDLQTSIDYILATGAGYRLPEPIRWAHRIAGGGNPKSN